MLQKINDATETIMLVLFTVCVLAILTTATLSKIYGDPSEGPAHLAIFLSLALAVLCLALMLAIPLVLLLWDIALRVRRFFRPSHQTS